MRLVIFNVYGHGNLGDAMLLESLVDILRENLSGEVQLRGIAFDCESERRWMPDVQWSERIGNKPQSGPIRRTRQMAFIAIGMAIAVSRRLEFLKWLLPHGQRQAVDALGKADIAVSCPGGYLEDSNGAYFVNILQIGIATRLARRTLLAPQSIGPIRSSLGRRLLKHAIGRVEKIFVRESWSEDFVRSLTNEGDTYVAPPTAQSGDLAFWFTRHLKQTLVGERERLGILPDTPILGLTLVDWSFPGAVNQQLARSLYLDTLKSFVDKVHQEGKHQIVVFNQVGVDLPFVSQLAEQRPWLIVDKYERDCATLAALVAQCDGFVGTRFHSCIFAMIGGVPTIAIAYLPKTTGIMQDLGLSDYVLPIEQLTLSQLLDGYRSICNEPGKMRAQILAGVARYKLNNNSFGTHISMLK